MRFLGVGVPPRESVYRTAVTRPSRRPQAARLLAALAPLAIATFAISIVLSTPLHLPAQPRTLSDSLFPHLKHKKLFPTCNSCHLGITTGSAAEQYPPVASCGECHNGAEVAPVSWNPPRALSGESLLAFNHRSHFAETDSAGRRCGACHTTPGDTSFMAVTRARAESCSTCHTHRATEHLASDNRCSTCHRPLTAATRLTPKQIASLPQPSAHRAASFIVAHGPTDSAAVASCATCHARPSCLRCHVDASSIGAGAALQPDPRVAEAIRGLSPRYPTPDDHLVASFMTGHGAAAQRNTARCATCHARPSCTACHTGSAAARTIEALPRASRGGAPGVRLVLERRATAGGRVRAASIREAARSTGSSADTSARTVRAHARDFVTTHGPNAASAQLSCQGCHAQRFCSECHAGETRRAFHALNFVSRHATESYAAERECSSCHNTEVFCRDCHRASGIGSARTNRAQTFHTAQPQWLLQHGRAARQNLSSCTTCHAQTSCMRCHATTGWGVNPHGPRFNAGRLGKRALTMCAACHLTDPRTRR